MAVTVVEVRERRARYDARSEAGVQPDVPGARSAGAVGRHRAPAHPGGLLRDDAPVGNLLLGDEQRPPRRRVPTGAGRAGAGRAGAGRAGAASTHPSWPGAGRSPETV